MGPMRTEASKQRGLAPRRRSPSVIMAHLKHLRAKWLAQAGLAAPAPVPAAPAAAPAASAPVPKPEQRLQQTAQPHQAAAEQHRGAQANGGTLLPKKRLLEAAGAAGTGPGPGQQERCAPAATALQRRSTRRVQALGRLCLAFVTAAIARLLVTSCPLPLQQPPCLQHRASSAAASQEAAADRGSTWEQGSSSGAGRSSSAPSSHAAAAAAATQGWATA